jgi:hypothetical protein
MNIKYIYLLVFFIFISCIKNNSEVVKSYRVKLSQEVGEFALDKNKDTVFLINKIRNINFDNKLLLEVKNKDTIIDYKYLSKEKIKNLSFRYYIKKDVLVGKDIFFFKNKKVNYKSMDFKLYGLSVGNGLVSHPRMIFFNKEYGILANAAYGASFLFLKDSISKLEREQLFNKIISKIEE